MSKRMKKGSPEAKAWGRRMRSLRSASRGRGKKVYKRARNISGMAKRSGRRSASKLVNVKKKHYELAGTAIVGALVGYELAKRL